MRMVRLAVLLGAALALTGCEFVDSQLLQGTRKYFPNAEVLKPRANVVHIETCVGNISVQFAAEVFDKMLQSKGREIGQGMALSGYHWLVLGFEDFNVVWSPYRNDFWIMKEPQFAEWWRSSFGSAWSID